MKTLASCFDLHFSWYLERYLRGDCDLIWLDFLPTTSNIQACTLMKIILLCSTTADTNNAEVKVKLHAILFSLCIYKSHRLLMGYDVNTNDFSNNIHIVRKYNAQDSFYVSAWIWKFPNCDNIGKTLRSFMHVDPSNIKSQQLKKVLLQTKGQAGSCLQDNVSAQAQRGHSPFPQINAGSTKITRVPYFSI